MNEVPSLYREAQGLLHVLDRNAEASGKLIVRGGDGHVYYLQPHEAVQYRNRASTREAAASK